MGGRISKLDGRCSGLADFLRSSNVWSRFLGPDGGGRWGIDVLAHDKEVRRAVLAVGKLCVLLCSGRGWTGFPFDGALFRVGDFVSDYGFSPEHPFSWCCRFFSLPGSRWRRPTDARGEMVCGYKLEVPVDILVEFFAWATHSFSDFGGSRGSAVSWGSSSRPEDLSFKFDFS